ncbi:hypothetical protein V5G24_23260 [Xanthobacter sp. VTT E-85241]|uniref:hypothetical protein n=1 Tax=Roseixanthobacter finlandensis TaxID=3119922 RepID=UPI0037271B42
MSEMTDNELRGRIMTLETMVVTLLGHMAAHTSDPAQFTAQVMDNTETMLHRAAKSAPKEMETTVRFALGSFEALSGQVLAHVHRYAVPKGRG